MRKMGLNIWLRYVDNVFDKASYKEEAILILRISTNNTKH